jgi:hypothetical protein
MAMLSARPAMPVGRRPARPSTGGWTRGAPGARAASASASTGRSSYSTSISGQRLLRDRLGFGRDRGHLVAHAAHAVVLERQVVLGHADRALPGHVGRGDDGMHAGQGPCARHVDAHDAGVHAAGAQDRRVELAGQGDVVDVARPAARLLGRIHLGDALADQAGGLRGDRVRHAASPFASVRPASTIASTIFW